MLYSFLYHLLCSVENLLVAVQPAFDKAGLVERAIEPFLFLSVTGNEGGRVRGTDGLSGDWTDAAIRDNSKSALGQNNSLMWPGVHTHVEEHVINSKRKEVPPRVPIFTMVDGIYVFLRSPPYIKMNYLILPTPCIVLTL